MKSVFVFIAAVLMASCAKLEFDELTDYPVADVANPVSNVNVNIEGEAGKSIPCISWTETPGRFVPSTVRSCMNHDGIIMSLIP